jgi:chemotaxis signal transduction protein/HPt (histidine-containing phosphotransfer) domain-containing protein
VTESREHIADIEEDLIRIEAGMEDVDPEVINRVFRAAHSIKGSAKFLDLANISDLAHKLEDVLNLIRGGKVIPSSEVAGPLLQAADMLKVMLEDVTASNGMDISEHVSRLQSIIDGTGSQARSGHRNAPSLLTEKNPLEPFGIDDRTIIQKLKMSQVYVLDLEPKESASGESADDLKTLGEILGSYETASGRQRVLFSTIMESDMIPQVLRIDSASFIQVTNDMVHPAKGAPHQAKAEQSGRKMKKTAWPAAEIPEEKGPAGDDEAPRENTAGQPHQPKGKVRFKGDGEEEKKEENTSFITFSLENETYAVPIQAIEEIIGYQDISLLPNVPDFIKGVINLRGELVPVMDLRLKFRLEPREYNPLTVFLIVRVEDRVMGLVVDNVADVLVIDPLRVQKKPVFSAKISTDFINGVYKDTQDQMVILVDVAALTKPDEWEVKAA